MGVHLAGQKSRASKGSIHDVTHVLGRPSGMHDGGEGGCEEIFISCPYVGIFGAAEYYDGSQGGGGGKASWEPNGVQIFGFVRYNSDTASKGCYEGKVTGMP